jgi:hypothetical protein
MMIDQEEIGALLAVAPGFVICLHPEEFLRNEVVRPTGPAYVRTSASPVRGMLRRRARQASAPYHRTVCARCGAWAVGLYWQPTLTPSVVRLDSIEREHDA